MTDTLGETLRKRREAADITQEALAYAAGMSTRGISDLERDVTKSMRKDNARRVIEVLGLTGADAEEFFLLARGRHSALPLQRPAVPAPPVEGAPAAAGQIFGRESAAAAALGLLTSGVGLLTLTGPGGVGKTRFGVELAARAARELGARAVFVPLAHVRDEALVAVAVAEALDVQAQAGRTVVDVLVERMRAERLVLVLDNLEQVTGAAGDIARLAAAGAGTCVIVTSRTVLRLASEHEFVLEPLASDDRHGGPAGRLFVDRAALSAPGWHPTPAELDQVGALCRALDGLPLAIVLAAAWMRVLGPGELLERAERHLRILTRGPRDSPERHRTMRAALDWSIDLLSPAAVVLLRRLSVWSGGVTLAQAEALAELGHPDDLDGLDVLDALAELADASLVRRTAAVPARYGMLTVVREYAQERLDAAGEATAAGRSHTAAVLEIVERCGAALTARGQKAALAELDDEIRNAEAAIERCVGCGDIETAQRVAGSLWRYWEIRGQLAAGRRWLDRVLAAPGPVTTAVRAAALNAAGNLARDQHDVAVARVHYEGSLELFTGIGDRGGIARALSNLGNVHLDLGDAAEAAARYREAIVVFEALPSPYHVALMCNNLALAMRHTGGDLAETLDLLDRSILGFRALGDAAGQARALESKARALDGVGRSADALSLHVEGLRLRRDLGDANGGLYSLEGLARSLAHLGRAREALRLLGHASRIRLDTGDPRTADDEVEVRPALVAATAALEPDAAETELRRGAESTLDEVLSLDVTQLSQEASR